MPTSLSGKSRLGGLSLNPISGRLFLQDLLTTATRGTSLSDLNLATLPAQMQDDLVEMIVQLIPKEVPLTKNQIRQILTSDNIPIFAEKLAEQDLAQGLDAENFGNAIMPMPLDLIYDDGMGDTTDPNRKYLTRNSLSLYVRVPSTNVASVTFGSSDGTLQAEGQLVGDPTVIRGEFINHTFRLEEALAATNLPAWPALEDELEQLFQNVTLYHSYDLNDHYTGYPMQPEFGPNGVVWETTIDVDVTQDNNFYYYHVELANPLTLETLNRQKLAELLEQASGGDGIPTVSDILNATKTYTINEWSMPDPRNLQLADRGILAALFDEDFNAVLGDALTPLLPQVASGTLTAQDLVNALGKDRLKLQNILLGNAEKVTTRFEQAFDPMLSSVFSIPKVDLESQSLWVASFDDIQDGNYFVGAVVYGEDGNPLDQMWSDITVDTKAPEADVAITAGNNTSAYENADGVYVATVLNPGPATLKVTGIPGPGRSNYVAQAEGYLLYQIIGLNPDGTPYLGDSSLQRPNTWMPLTPEATMLASTVWDQTIAQLVSQGALPEEIEFGGVTLPTQALTLDTVLGFLGTPLGLGFIENDPTLGPAIKGLGDFLGQDLLDPGVLNLLVEVFGDIVELINHIPITDGDPNNDVMMLAQIGKHVLVGDYGIRAMGIDNLFNVSSHTAPTQLRIVDPATNIDSATITLAQAHGDFDNDGMLDPVYKTDIIYRNSGNVMISGTVENLKHPIVSVMLQYMDASGNWANIGEATVMGADFEGTWNVTDFDALIGAGDSVMVRAVATNKLELTDTEPMPFSIELDGGIYPPEVLNITVDEASITMRNPDSEAPQGMVTINATTLPQTGPETVKVRFVATLGDGEPIELGTVTREDGLVDAVQSAVDAAVEGADAPINTDETVWSLHLDTTTLEDTITKDSDAARGSGNDELYTVLPNDSNPYTIRAFAVSADETEWPSDATAMLSVDNVDDVGPLGPTNITVIADADGPVEADTQGVYTLRGLIDPHDSSVVSPVATLTIKPTAERKTYESVMLVSEPEIDPAVIIEGPEETAEGSGIFTVTIDVGALGIEGNGTYKLHALADDKFNNGQDGESPESTVLLKNYLRPDPAVFKIAKDLSTTDTNVDSGGPQGTFMFTGYTIEQNSPPIESIRLKAKRTSDSDTEWTTIGTGDASAPVDIDMADAALPSALDHLVDVAAEGTTAGNRSVVAIGETYNAWAVTVDTRALGLEDTITKDSTGARAIDTHGAWDASLDDNPYEVRAFAVDASGKEWPSDATVMFSLDNVDDVAPLGPTNVSVTSVEATENSVFEDAGDGSFTVGGLVDKYDDAVASPVATFTIEPTARRETYDAVRFVPGVEGLVITDVTETADGVFELTVDVGTLADGETYLDNGTYMFYALAFDEFGNEQEDMSETDGSKISVMVTNTRRPVPQLLAFTVGDPTQTNPDSGAPQGTIALYGYTPEITSAPTNSVMFEVKRKNDTEWTEVGTASDTPEEVTAADDAKLAAATIADVADVPGGIVAKSDTYQRWMIEVDTTTLEDSITKDNPGARDHTKDDNMYMVRATASATADGSANLSAEGVTAMFSVDNVDDVAPLEPTNIVVTSVDGVDTVFETTEDDSFTVGGLVDKYDIEGVPSPVATFTITPVAERITYKSVKLTMYPEGALVGEITETAEGSGVFTVTVDVGILADRDTYLENGTYTFQALAYDGVMDVVDDEFGNVETPTDDSKVSVTVENSYRPAPEVLALAVDPESITKTNPDSGAPQGTITVHAYSHEISSPPTKAVRIEVKRPGDAEWIDAGTATDSMATTEVSDATLTDFVSDLANTAVSATEAGETEPVAINQTYQMWAIDVDTTTLEDTITADSEAARDASKDDNQYMVRAVPIEEADDFADPEASPNATAMFSVDNVDDVSPEGPTHIVAVSDVAGMIRKNEDNSYTVGGIVDDTVPSPIAIFTTEQDAAVDPITYEGGSVNLVQTTADGTETVTMGEAGVLDTITIDVGMLENGTYMFHALTVDEFGNVQTDESPKITVHVLNFRVSDVSDLAVIAVDGTDVADAPTEPIPLRESVTVSFMVANGSLAAEELSGAVNGQSMPSESDEDPENTFTLLVEVGSLVDGIYTPDGVVTQRNGSVAFPLTTVNVDNTGPMVMIESPTDGEAVDSLPTFHASYHDGAGAGVDGETGSLALARLQPPDAVDVEVDQEALAKDDAALVYTRTERLAGGAYRVTVEVIDILGNVGSGSQEFVVNGTLPTVAIHSPASGQTFDHGQPLISGEFSGAGSVELTTLTVNDDIVEPEVEGNRFSYTPETALANGNHTVAVLVTDGDDNTAQTSVTFTVEKPRDTTPPVISAVAPNGVIKDSDPNKLGAVVISAVVTDEQSAVSSVRYSINGAAELPVPRVNITEGRITAPVDYEANGDGLYTVRLAATSEGGTTEITWTFTLMVDNVKPIITSITPSGTIRGGLPVISASANDESGVAEMSIIVRDSDGEEVEGETQDDGEDGVSGITRLDFNPADPLEEGVYTIEVRATDPYSNSSSSKGTFTVDFDTAAPVITLASPANNARLMYDEGEERRPTIAISYADAESGIDVDSIRFVFNDNLITLTPQQKSASQVTYKPAQDLDPGQYSVKLEVSDRANQEGNVSDESDGAREANMAVYEFTFSVELNDGPILAARPLNYPNPFKDNTRISFTLARQATVSIVIYDATLRPVRVLVDNQVFDAGNYTRKDNGSDAIGWDGKSSSGEDLARGIYFCEIIVADGFEPEYAILKLALTR